MTATITTTTTSTTTYTSDDPSFVGTLRLRGAYDPEAFDITGGTRGPGGQREGLADALDDMDLPSWLKDFAREALGLGQGQGGGLPSDASAAKTIRDFQKDNDISLLNVDQMKQMADTGYCTKDGKTFQVPPEVQEAAQAMMANNGELFKKMESAYNGKHDGQLSTTDYDSAVEDGTIAKDGGAGGGRGPRGLSAEDFLNAIMNGNIATNRPTEYGAAKTINDFQKEHDIGLLSVDQLQQIADTGYCTGKDGKTFQVPEEVQGAAEMMMEDNGALFKKLESATDGKHDGQLGQGDFDEALKDGTLGKDSGTRTVYTPIPEFGAPGGQGAGGNGLPSDASAASTIKDFQKDKGIDLLSIDQIQQMAETGYCKDKDGKTIQVPEETQLAAQKLMENNGELFKKLESAVNGKHDGLLSTADYDAAVDDGTIGKGGGKGGGTPTTTPVYTPGVVDGTGTPGLPSLDTPLPSKSDAAKTIKDFQQEKDIGLLSIDQVQSMAQTGYCKDKDGNTVQVPEEVQLAAQKMLENNSALFKTLEASVTGKHDGQLSTADYDAAVKDGSIKA